MFNTLKEIVRPYKYKMFSLYQSLFAGKEKEHTYHKLSYSQEGEDMVLSRIFREKKDGFYIDVGAFHPQHLSNTYFFYLLGWRGINIDAMPGSMDIFKKVRPKDINLELPISDLKEELTYYKFNAGNLNGFSKDISLERNGWKVGDWEAKLIGETKLQTYTLAEVLEKHLPKNQIIDFLSIDVEGLDYQVLKSNNWQKYRPKIVLVEDLNLTSISPIGESQLHLLMRHLGYQLYSKTVNSLIFKSEDFQVEA